MLKFAKKLLLILGALVIVAAAVLVLYEFRLSSNSLNTIVAQALQQKSNTDIHYYDATQHGILLATVGGLLGGLILGLGIGIPSETFKQKYEERQAKAAQKIAAATPAPSSATPEK
jgi:flagellar basal body-associated protein FliL